MADTPTNDPNIVIEAKTGKNYIRYRHTKTGRRWEVRGTCDRRGDCIVGAFIPGYTGKGMNGTLADKADLLAARQAVGLAAIEGELDVPSTPECHICCFSDGTLVATELTPPS